MEDLIFLPVEEIRFKGTFSGNELGFPVTDCKYWASRCFANALRPCFYRALLINVMMDLLGHYRTILTLSCLGEKGFGENCG